MDHDEAVSILLQLVVAGSESTSSLIGAMAHRLALRPETSATTSRNPEQRSKFIEEVLRMDSPFKGHFRVLNQEDANWRRDHGAGNPAHAALGTRQSRRRHVWASRRGKPPAVPT